MPEFFEPKTAILPQAQQEIWPLLAPAAALSFVLYGGTAVAVYLGHRISVISIFSGRRLSTKRTRGIISVFARRRDRSRR